MVFGFFSRRSQSSAQVAASNSTTTLNDQSHTQTQGAAQQRQLRTPSPSVQSLSYGGKPTSPHLFEMEGSPAMPPLPTPSPAPEEPDHTLITDPTPLYTLVLSIPPKAFQDYTLSQLIKSEPAIDPRTLTHLSKFFSGLTPPPLLHCVRCHKDYYEAQNADQSCLIPHDDESAEVERVGTSKKGKVVGGFGTEYETLWGCCGKVVEGDGDMGPPDGWCYEGKHTTDVKRARFRADSTIQEDKLVSCERMRCNGNPRGRSTRSTRKRGRVEEVADGEDEKASLISHSDVDAEEEPSQNPATRPVKRLRTKSVVTKSVLRRGVAQNAEDAAAAAASPAASGQAGDTDVEMETEHTFVTPARPKPKPKPRARSRSSVRAKSKLDVSSVPADLDPDAEASAFSATPVSARPTRARPTPRSRKPVSSASTASSSKAEFNVPHHPPAGVPTPTPKASPTVSNFNANSTLPSLSVRNSNPPAAGGAGALSSQGVRPYVMIKSRDTTPSKPKPKPGATRSRSSVRKTMTNGLGEVVDGSVDGETMLAG